MSVGLEGMKGHDIVVEADVRHEKETCVIIGLPDAPMKESKERILSCLHTLGLDISNKKITVHLSPPDKRKTGAGHDCAMLVAVLQQMLDEPLPIERDTCFLAALSLTGKLLPYHGIIPSIQQAMKLGFKQIVVPPIDLTFLEHKSDVTFVQIETVSQLISSLQGEPLPVYSFDSFIHLSPLDDKNEEVLSQQIDFSSIRGHPEAKHTLEIAAAGGHHVLLKGTPGCGKSMLADAFHTIFPDFDDEEMLEVFSIYHLAKESRGFSRRPPYRHPHHSAFGPLLDRFDFILTLKNVGLKRSVSAENSESVRERATKARLLQKHRYGNNGLNGNVPFFTLMKTCQLSKAQLNYLHEICFLEKWSNRSQTKIIRIARTMADLNGERMITNDILNEAIHWRRQSKKPLEYHLNKILAPCGSWS